MTITLNGINISGKAYVGNYADIFVPTLPVTLINPARSQGSLFVYSVAISGDRAIVGAHQEDTGATSRACIFAV